MTEKIFIKSEKETREFGVALAAGMKAGDVIALVGELGTGKTTLTKYFAAGLGVTEDVTSPTFTIIREYKSGRLPLYHFDVYRLSGEEDLYDRGCDEYFFGDGVSIIEWADKVGGAIPGGSTVIRLSYGSGEFERIFDIGRAGVE